MGFQHLFRVACLVLSVSGAAAWHTWSPTADATDLELSASDVRFAVMGNRNREGLFTGDSVPVFVPWGGVNEDPRSVDCLVGPLVLKSDGSQEEARIGSDEVVSLRLRLLSNEDGTWDVEHSAGRCASLSASGVFRRTLWDDGAISYRFIGTANVTPGEDAEG